MNDLPVPNLTQRALQPTRWPATVPQQNVSTRAAPPAGLSVSWARHLDEVREAQRLRHDVFVHEMGAKLNTPLPGYDVDLFDDFCEHLLVRETRHQSVIGTYRVLTPVQARRLGGTYTDSEFDLTRLRSLRARMVELGRSCVHIDHRQGGVILALWAALGDFMHRNGLDSMVGCASIPMGAPGGLGAGDVAASIWQRVARAHMAPVQFQVQARVPLPVDQLNGSLNVEPPALIKGYLRMGARVLGAPAWDPAFNTADLPMLLCVQDLPARYQRHFLGA